jgi:hypothetical protein
VPRWPHGCSTQRRSGDVAGLNLRGLKARRLPHESGLRAVALVVSRHLPASNRDSLQLISGERGKHQTPAHKVGVFVYLEVQSAVKIVSSSESGVG